jgi:hypothetical protein
MLLELALKARQVTLLLHPLPLRPRQLSISLLLVLVVAVTPLVAVVVLEACVQQLDIL